MKNIILTIIILLIGNQSMLSQSSCDNNESNCENGNGITTNPSYPTNPNCSNFRNTFDWRVQRTDGLPEDYIIYGPSTTYKEIQNPFTGPSGTSYFGNIVNQTNSN